MGRVAETRVRREMSFVSSFIINHPLFACRNQSLPGLCGLFCFAGSQQLCSAETRGCHILAEITRKRMISSESTRYSRKLHLFCCKCHAKILPYIHLLSSRQYGLSFFLTETVSTWHPCFDLVPARFRMAEYNGTVSLRCDVLPYQGVR